MIADMDDIIHAFVATGYFDAVVSKQTTGYIVKLYKIYEDSKELIITLCFNEEYELVNAYINAYRG